MLKNKKHFKLSLKEKTQSQRQLKVSQLVNVSLVECLRKGKKLSPALDNSPLTITKVVMSTDLRVANCFFLPFNTNLTADEIANALNESRYVIRDYITRNVRLKYSPEIRFYYDTTFNNIVEIEKLLKL